MEPLTAKVLQRTNILSHLDIRDNWEYVKLLSRHKKLRNRRFKVNVGVRIFDDCSVNTMKMAFPLKLREILLVYSRIQKSEDPNIKYRPIETRKEYPTLKFRKNYECYCYDCQRYTVWRDYTDDQTDEILIDVEMEMKKENQINEMYCYE